MKKFSNLFRKPLFLFFAALLIMGCLILHTSISHAYSCDKTIQYDSPEKNFIISDLVFSGVAKPHNDGSTTFKLKEWYKSPDKTYESKGELVTTPVSMRFDANTEYIIYAELQKSADSEVSILISPCRTGTFFHPEAFLKILRKIKNKPDLIERRIGFRDDLIVRCTVKKILHVESPKNKLAIESDLELELQEIFNDSNKSFPVKDLERVTLRAHNCGRSYAIGQEYVVMASHGLVRNLLSPSPKRIPQYVLTCMPTWNMDVHAHDKLRHLAKQLRQKADR